MVGYLEEDDEDASRGEGRGDGDSNSGKVLAEIPAEGPDNQEDGEERRPSGTAGVGAGAAERKKTTFRVAGQAVMLVAGRGSGLAGDPLVS